MKRYLILILAALLFCQMAEARQPQRGYRGFFEWSNSLRSEEMGYPYNGGLILYRENTYYTGFSTSHGYQINPMFFVGAGLGMEMCTDFDNWIVPLFVEGRADLQFGKFTPFGDIRLGANLSEGTGVYFSPTIGYRFNWGRKMGVNIGAGLSLAGYKAYHYDIIMDDPGTFNMVYLGTKNHVRAYFTFRVGIDF
ncbi:MAG: hypothetical protein K2K55_09655 [Duncaniella sp.]|nr:hypothetical protein [Duncaniella sp.]